MKSTDGENVGDNHDDERDEERHKGADQNEIVVHQLAAFIPEDFGVIMQAKDWDGHGDNLRQIEKK